MFEMTLNGATGTAGGTGYSRVNARAIVVGAARTFTLDLMAAAMQQAYSNGGKPTAVFMSPRLKRVFSGSAVGGAGNTIVAQQVVQSTATEPITIAGAVDAYLSDFGRLQMVPDIFMPDGVMLMIDPNYADIAPLSGRDMLTERFAITGDAADGGVTFEGTLRVEAPKAHAMIGDLS